MNKYYYFLGLCLVMLFSPFMLAYAQISRVTVKVPDFKRFVVITQDNVNLRRTPSVNGGKLMQWESDGGSFDTYCKIYFADTEASLYRPNSFTGARVETYHPLKDELLAVNPNKLEPQNGWYQVGVTAQAYAGNPDKANAKLAWVKSDFCKVIDIDMNAKPSQFKFSRYIYFNSDREENTAGPDVTIREGVRRTSGLYNNITFFLSPAPDGNSVLLTAPIASNHFLYVARLCMEVEYDSEQKTAVVMHEEEDEIGAGNVYLRLTTNTNSQKAVVAVNYILKSSDAVFGKIVKCLFPDNKIPTDEVYYMTTSGKCESFGYDPNISSVIPSKTSSMSLQKVLDNASTSKNSSKTYDVVDNMPSFPGGRDAMMAFLSSNMTYPEVARKNNVQGRVIVGFVVGEDGSITEAKVLKSADSALDKEALRLVNSMPKWKPGTMNGKPVRVKYSVPFTFRL